MAATLLRSHSNVTLTSTAALLGGALYLYRRRRIQKEGKKAKEAATNGVTTTLTPNMRVTQRVKSDQLSVIVDALAEIALKPPPNGAVRWIVALCGIPGAGKSTLAFTLQHAINGKIAHLRAAQGINDDKDAFTSITMDGTPLPLTSCPYLIFTVM
jgi:predicted ATP-dependent serine protease